MRKIPNIDGLTVKYGLLCVKIVWAPFCTIFVVLASQKMSFLTIKKWKMIFINIIWKTSVLNIVCHNNTHLCVKYGHIITNYGTGMIISRSFDSKLIHVYRWLTFCEEVLRKLCQNSSLSFFLATSTHKKTSCQRISFFQYFLTFFYFFWKKGQKWPVP